MLGGILGGLSSSITNNLLGIASIGLQAYNSYQQQQNYESNFQQQKNAFAYNVGLQNTIFNREDNAVQRRAADLKAAGLSPVLAAGSAANAGAVIHTDAPQQQTLDIPNMLQAVMSLMKMKEDITNTVAQRDLIKAQQTKTLSSTLNDLVNLDVKDAHIKNINADTNYKNINAAYSNLELKRARESGQTKSSSMFGKIFSDIIGTKNAGYFIELEDKAKNIDPFNQKKIEKIYKGGK